MSTNNSSTTTGRWQTVLLILVSFFCGAALCSVSVLGGGYYLAEEQLGQMMVNLVLAETEESPSTATPIITPTVTTTPTEAPTETTITPTTPSDQSLTPTPRATAELSEQRPIKPQFSHIIFALDARKDDYTPINPGQTFPEGITEIHAIFEYVGMSKNYDWQRVWYRDGEEILRNQAAWTGHDVGRFDYFIDAAGNPLPAGQWELELYVENQLMVTGSFTIGLQTPSPTPRPRPNTQVDQQPTATPVIIEPAEPTTQDQLAGQPTTTPAAEARPSDVVYKLAYTKWDGGQHNLHVADTNGNGQTFLLNRAAGPSWTPDGQQIFFFGEEGVDRQRLPDGQEVLFPTLSNGIVVLTNASALPGLREAELFQDISWKQGRARWANVSPNGQMVAFDAEFGGSYRLFFLGTTGNEQFRVEIPGEQADWSPDSERLVYRSGRNGMTGLWISNRIGTEHYPLTNGGSDSFPAWSSDGQTIAFSRSEGGNIDIYAINPDGSNLRRLTDSLGIDTLPTYTPADDLIYRTTRPGRWAIWKMTGDGQGQVEIISDAPVGQDWAYSRMDVN